MERHGEYVPPGGWVSRGLCPTCHHELSADEESVYCPACAWRPTELSEENE
jgi:Zn finger protein HypA/HybF involved in hydrogenase expression